MNSLRQIRQFKNLLNKDSILNSILMTGFFIAILQGLALCTGYVLQLLLARWLGSVEYGKYSYALSWANFFCIVAALGLPTAALRFIPHYLSQNRWEAVYGFHKTGLTWLIFSGLSISMAASFIIYFTLTTNNYKTCLLISAWIVPAACVMSFHNEFLRAMHKVISSFLLPQLAFPIFLIVFSCILYLNGNTLKAFHILVLTLVANILIVLVQWYLIYSNKANKTANSSEAIKSSNLLAVSIPLLAINLFTFSMQQTDLLVIGSIMGPEEAGIYAVSVKISGLANFILHSINTLAAPVYAGLYSERKFTEMQRVVKRLAHIMFWPSVVIALIILFFSTQILHVFGVQFVRGKTALLILIIGNLFNVSTGSVGFLSDLTGLQFQAAIIRGFGATLNVVLTLMLVPYAGMTGAAFATAGCLAFCNICLLRLVRKKHGISSSIWFAVMHRS